MKALTDWLTLAEAAERLGLSGQRVGQLIQAGRLPAAKFGKVWLVHKEDLAAFQPQPPGRPRKNKEGPL